MDEGDNFFDYMSKIIDQIRTKIKEDEEKINNNNNFYEQYE